MAKAVALLSGGLDSTLAAYLIGEQGIELNGLAFVSVFHPGPRVQEDHRAARAAAQFLRIPLKVVDHTDRLLAIVKAPRHGYGSQANPCIDCRVDMLRQGKDYLDELGGEFLVTGEVLGQRPMSQRRDAMHRVDKQAGVKDLVVRPLCAKLLEPTIPEQRGLVDRDKLLDISGRSRRRQMDLAERIGLTDYPSPAGGCLLTDPGFARRLGELLAHDDATPSDIELLKVGRHFRLDDGTKVVVGRDDADNQRIRALARDDDLILELQDVPGPTVLLRGTDSADNVTSAAGLAVRYSKARDRPAAAVRVSSCGQQRSVVKLQAPPGRVLKETLG